MRDGGLPVRLLEPAEAARRFPAFSIEGVAAVLHDAAGGVLQARRATLGWRDWRPRRARRCARARACAPSATASSSSPTAASERADQVLVATGAWTSALLAACPSARRSRSTSTCGCATAGLPVWTYDLDVYGLCDDGGAGLKVGGHAVGPDVDPDDPAAREAPPAEVQRLADAARRRLPGLPWPERRARRSAAPTSAATR